MYSPSDFWCCPKRIFKTMPNQPFLIKSLLEHLVSRRHVYLCNILLVPSPYPRNTWLVAISQVLYSRPGIALDMSGYITTLRHMATYAYVSTSSYAKCTRRISPVGLCATLYARYEYPAHYYGYSPFTTHFVHVLSLYRPVP